MKIAVTGNPKLGGVQMRGESLANACGWDFIPLHKLKPSDQFDLLILVKYWKDATLLRAIARRLVWDCLDSWEGLDQGHQHPQDFFRWARKRLAFDELISTSPRCQREMQNGLPGVKVHLLPHHADPRIQGDWYWPGGPAVYAGAERFILEKPMANACWDHLQRPFVVNYSRDCWESLRGASYAVIGRCGATNHLLNDLCKPQVKLENALAAGLPIFGRLDTAGVSVLAPRKPDGSTLEIIPTGGPLGTLEIHPAGASPVTLAASAEGYKAIFERGEAYDWTAQWNCSQ